MSTKITLQFKSQVIEVGSLTDKDINYGRLLATAKKVFALPSNKPVVLQYKDDEGDLITVSSQADIAEALLQAKSTKKMQFYVNDSGVVDYGFELVDDNLGSDVDQKKPDSPQDATSTTPLAESAPVANPSAFGVSEIIDDRVKILSRRLLAEFVRHETLPDRSVHSTNTRLTKTWVVENIGACTWPEGCVINWMSGDECLKSRGFLTAAVLPGEKARASIDIVLPSRPGRYTAFFQLANPSGKESFGPHLWIDVIAGQEEDQADMKQSEKPIEPKSAPAQQKPQPQQPSCPQTFGKYNAPMKQLWDMGYRDLGLNVYLLDQNNGDIQKVVLQLVEKSGK